MAILDRITKSNQFSKPGPYYNVNSAWINYLIDSINSMVTGAGAAKIDTISEYTSGSGVTADGVLLKDGNVLADDGAAATPSISFADYNNMGMYVSSGTELAFATEGSFVARLSQLHGLEVNQVYCVRYIKSQVAPVNSNTDPADKAVMATSLLTGLLTATPGGAIDYTLPTGTEMDTACASHVGVDESFDFNIINIGAGGIITFVAADGFTIVGTATVATNTSASFRVRKTAANTFVLYRLV
jgi:hypothetical protein